MIPTSFPAKEEIARLTAGMLLEIGAIAFNAKEPFTHASGKQAPTYVDCRKLISFPRIRSTLMDFLSVTIMREAGFEAFDNVAGGETAGIPFGAMVAERLALRVILVEDLTTDGGSKLSFVDAIRETGATCNATAVIFYYGIFEGVEKTLSDHGVQLISLCTWWDVLAEAKARNAYDADTLAAVEAYLRDPAGWTPG